MKNVLFLLMSGILFSAAPLCSQESGLSDRVAVQADSLLGRSAAMGEQVGLSAGILADGKVVWQNQAGWSDRKAAEPVDEHTVLRLASISKSMTAVAIMQLMEKGLISLDEPIQTYVPEFPVKPEGIITVRHLLTHTSGIQHYKGTLDGFSLREYADLTAAMNRFKKRDLAGTPGKVYQYTTYGYVVLGVIIEKVSGIPYEAYMKKYIWDPAGMYATSVEHKKEPVPDKSRLYRITKKGKLKKDLNTNLSMKIPGGGIQSTAGDLLRFGQAIIENKLLNENTLAEMLRDPGIRKGGNPYAMGWFLYSTEPGNRIIGHSGSQAGAASQLLILLDRKAVVACISNTRGSWNTLFGLSWQLAGLLNTPRDVQAGGE